MLKSSHPWGQDTVAPAHDTSCPARFTGPDGHSAPEAFEWSAF